MSIACRLASVPVFGALFLLGNYTLWTHFNALDVSKPLDPPLCPSPPTYTSPSQIRFTGLAVPDAILCTLVSFFGTTFNSSGYPHAVHFILQLPGVLLPFTVERTRSDGSIFISHFLLGTAYQLKGAGLITPLGYLLTLLLTSSVRDRARGTATTHGTAPLTKRQAESILVSVLLGFAFPTAMMLLTHRPYWTALWQFFPWGMSATQALYLLVAPRPSSNNPGSGSALFISTMHTLSTAAAIAHWAFLYYTFTAPSFSLSHFLTFAWFPSVSIPPHDIPAAEAFAHFLEWDAVVSYLTAFLAGLWLLGLARTKSTSVAQWVREALGKILVGVLAGPGAMLCTMWGEREDALVHAYKAESEKTK